jgi:DNA-binding PadR family transcriptional regulator
MQRNRAASEQTIRVLAALGEDPLGWRHGYDLCRETGLKAGTMYPILMRLADRGMLETSWESGGQAGRPPRHLYRLTVAGVELTRELSARSGAKVAAGLRPRWEGAR